MLQIMKILYLANIRMPSQKAASLQIMKMLEAFALQNAEVELVVPRRRNPQLKHQDPFEYYNIEKKFKITKLLSFDLMSWRKLLGSFAFKFNYWVFARFSSIYARLAMADVIYSRDWRTLQLLRRSKKNLIFEMHEFREKDVWAYKSIEPSCLQIVVISYGLKKKLVAAGLTENKILVAPDAVTLKEFDFNLTQPKAREALNIDKEGELIVYTGGLYEWKGIYTLIDGFVLLRQHRDNIKLFLVGGMEADVQQIKDYLMEKEIQGVVVLGHRPYTEIPLFMKAADILVLADSAKFDIAREYTSPLKLFQYMAAKRVIVASNTPAIQETLSQDNAWLFTPDNPESLAFVFANALENVADSQKKVKNAFMEVQEFTWENRARQIIDKILLIKK